MNDLDEKLLDPRWYRTDAYLEGFQRLRDEDPVHWTEDARYGKDFWAVTRHDDLEELLLNDRDFSNRRDVHVPRSPKRMTPEERHAQGFDVLMPFLDNPMHDVYRRPFNRHFSKPAIGKLRQLTDDTIDGILDELAETGIDEAVNGFALSVSTRVVLHWYGVPDEDWAKVQRAVYASGRGFVPSTEDERSENDHNGIWDYSRQLAADRMKAPKEDFLSAVVSTKVDGEPMSLHEATATIFILLEGAVGNTRNALAYGLWLLLANPDQAELLRTNPELMNSAVDEVIRHAANSPTRLRVANRDLEFGGQEIRFGDWMVGFTKSANFDERRYDSPMTFDITRNDGPGITFGSGVHNCLGRHLARLEMSVAFSKLYERFIPEFAGDVVWGNDSPGARLLAEMPMTLRAR
ncbi:cytochrome P450 [Microbacterium aoyamense]|uniref:cytochrome P450 n=1 Tax=Microbacterium aoyamense TaxID=344166 RepID=UPI002004D33A|nr:cytochrome P450 [Microbacterium aoyamense]